jgi:hypothetical protein
MLRPVSWISPAGVSPVQVVIGRPGSRPRFVVVKQRVERGVKSLVFVGSEHAGRSVVRCESCSLVKVIMEKLSRSYHGEGHVRQYWCTNLSAVGFSRGTEIGTCVGIDSEQERPVCVALSAKTVWISQW